jgi:hypothetical protein
MPGAEEARPDASECLSWVRKARGAFKEKIQIGIGPERTIAIHGSPGKAVGP